MIYRCDSCGFLFRRSGAVEECPFCEEPHFRPATAEEAERLMGLLKERESYCAGGKEKAAHCRGAGKLS